jgi:hypothetical protein
VSGFEQRAFRGCGVFVSNPFETTDDTESMQLLQRNSQVGEYYIVPKSKDVLLYDEEADTLVKFTDGDLAAAAKGTQPTGVTAPTTVAGYLICRPFIEHIMTSAVMTVAGRDTGATLFGPAGKLTHSNPLQSPPQSPPILHHCTVTHLPNVQICKSRPTRR